jgi:hypothetical protein
MHFHWCGNPVHDIVHNAVVLLALMPETLPLLGHLRSWALRKYKNLHVGDACNE